MTGRNPWVVLCVPEDSPYHEVQRAFRRRVKQTHPDSGGNAGEFATVVRAFEDVRQALSPPLRRSPVRPTPYDGWLRPCCPTPSGTGDVPPVAVTPPGSVGSGVTLTMPSAGSDFRTVLLGEMSKVSTTANHG